MQISKHPPSRHAKAFQGLGDDDEGTIVPGVDRLMVVSAFGRCPPSVVGLLRYHVFLTQGSLETFSDGEARQHHAPAQNARIDDRVA
jgi:hypothetical protein